MLPLHAFNPVHPLHPFNSSQDKEAVSLICVICEICGFSLCSFFASLRLCVSLFATFVSFCGLPLCFSSCPFVFFRGFLWIDRGTFAELRGEEVPDVEDDGGGQNVTGLH